MTESHASSVVSRQEPETTAGGADVLTGIRSLALLGSCANWEERRRRDGTREGGRHPTAGSGGRDAGPLGRFHWNTGCRLFVWEKGAKLAHPG